MLTAFFPPSPSPTTFPHTVLRFSLFHKNRRVQIDEYIFNLDKRDKFLAASIKAGEKAAVDKAKLEKASHH